MAFLDSFKKNELRYVILLATGAVVLVFNNLLQFLDMVMRYKWLILLSPICLLYLIVYMLKNKEEVFK
ncbi:MAG: hypothetical protein Q8R00_00750 [Candidatus Nanoarchaeia archaeon]|nr:hypothetical protein [Candidatus Nanoarchaeia archaeon]